MTSPQVYDEGYFAIMRPPRQDGRPEEFVVHRRFLEELGDAPLQSFRILDVGCGQGELLHVLRKLGVNEVHGIDFSPTAVASSRRLLRESFGNGLDETVQVGSIGDRSLFPEGSFDLVFMADIVEHLPQAVLEDGLANVRYWLNDGGRLLIHTFPTLGPHRVVQLYLYLRRSMDFLQSLNTIHCNVQTRRRLRATLGRAGLQCSRMWVENDVLETSSFYQMMSPRRQKIARFLVDDVLRSKPVNALIRMLGLSEWAQPSIYCVCTKSRR